MAAAKDTKKTVKKDSLSAKSLRTMKPAERSGLLAEKRADILEAKRSLKAQELANPSRVKELRRHIALIMTIENESTDAQQSEKPQANSPDDKENK